MSESKVKSGRGRTLGSYSFVTVPLKELCSQLGENTNVIVSRKWVEAIGLQTNAVAKNSLETIKQTSVASSDAVAPLAATIEL